MRVLVRALRWCPFCRRWDLVVANRGLTRGGRDLGTARQILAQIKFTVCRGDYEIATGQEHGFEICGVLSDDGTDMYGIRICGGLFRYCCAIEI